MIREWWAIVESTRKYGTHLVGTSFSSQSALAIWKSGPRRDWAVVLDTDNLKIRVNKNHDDIQIFVRQKWKSR